LRYTLVILLAVFALATADTTLDRIMNAASAGDITPEEAALYMVMSVRERDLLPVAFTEGAVSDPCGTPALLEAGRLLDLNSSPLGDESGYRLARPTLSGPEITFVTPSDHFRIHYTNQGGDAVTEAYAISIGQAADYSWQVQCDEMNYFYPPPDANMGGCNRYDIYIMVIDALGYTTPGGEFKPPDSTHNASASHIVINTNLSPNLVKVTVAHEFQHAVQMTYDYTEPTWFMENCAVFMEETVYPEVNDYMNYLMGGDTPIRKPWYDIRSGGTTLYWYGGVTWAFYIWQRQEIEAVQTVWENCAEVRGGNMMPALEDMFESYGMDFEQGFMEYGYWRWFVADNWLDGGMYFEEAASWSGNPYVFNFHNFTSLPASGDNGVYAPEALGIHWIRVDLEDYQDGWVNFSFDGRDNFEWNLGVILWDTDGSSQCTWYDTAYPGGTASVSVETAGWDYAIFYPAMLSLTTLEMTYTFDISYSQGVEGGIVTPGQSLSVQTNPLAPGGVVSFTLQQSGNARLALYDLSGRMVSTLANGQLEAGTHSVSISDEIATGTYFLMLNHSGGAETMKVLVTR
jgi:hypothetical protein